VGLYGHRGRLRTARRDVLRGTSCGEAARREADCARYAAFAVSDAAWATGSMGNRPHRGLGRNCCQRVPADTSLGPPRHVSSGTGEARVTNLPVPPASRPALLLTKVPEGTL
jgi:hypothetical protein